jgi:hypothetical protein
MDRTKVQQFAESIWQGVDYLNHTLTLQERVLAEVLCFVGLGLS